MELPAKHALPSTTPLRGKTCFHQFLWANMILMKPGWSDLSLKCFSNLQAFFYIILGFPKYRTGYVKRVFFRCRMIGGQKILSSGCKDRENFEHFLVSLFSQLFKTFLITKNTGHVTVYRPDGWTKCLRGRKLKHFCSSPSPLPPPPYRFPITEEAKNGANSLGYQGGGGAYQIIWMVTV